VKTVKRPAIVVFDLGASGGRLFAATQVGHRLTLEEIYRFEHRPYYFWQADLTGQALVRRHCWDFGRLYAGMLEGLSRLALRDDIEPISIGIDTWGSDGVWLTAQGDMLGPLATGRDPRWIAAAAEIAARVGERAFFERTAIRSDPFCVVNQVYWFVRYQPELVRLAATYMPLHSLLNYYLCGERAAEYTWLSTTGLVRPGSPGYLQDVGEQLGIPLDKMPPHVLPGAVLGRSHSELTKALGLKRQLSIIVPAVHDTASAYLAAPFAHAARPILISTGTWFLVGIPMQQPLTGTGVYQARLTNIGGYTQVYFQGILLGSWPAQELRRQWSARAGRQLAWEELGRLAEVGVAGQVWLDIDDEALRAPLDMEQAISEFCRCTGQPASLTRPQMIRAVYEGLALKTALICEQMQSLADYQADEIVLVGGGAQNAQVTQWLADASRLPVRVGPIAAAAMGNAIVQACTLGWYASVAEGRQAMASGEQEQVYLPRPARELEQAKQRLKTWIHLQIPSWIATC
jgi:rhamnulokinase